jgi:transcriptional regulator with XRE-family HTH domain
MVVLDMGLRLSPEALRTARRAAGYTQQEAAEAAGLRTDKSIRSAEKGVHVLASERLARLARLYGVPMEQFFIHDPEADMASTVCGPTEPGASDFAVTAAPGRSPGA